MTEHDTPEATGRGAEGGPQAGASGATGPISPDSTTKKLWAGAPPQPGTDQPQPYQPPQGGYSPHGYPTGSAPQGAYAAPGHQPGFGAQSPFRPAGYEQPTTPFGWPPPSSAPTATATATRPSRLRIGLVGLAAGALIGGGAGAGVASLVEQPRTTATASGPAAQSVVIKDPTNATTATAAAAKAAPSVVTIYVTNGNGAGSGSGVVLSSDGYVLTNNHVVTLESSQPGDVQVRTADGKLYDATVVGTDPTADLAVVKLTGASGLTPATFANSDKVQVGDLAVAIGAPLGLSNTVTDGIISATDRAVATGSTQGDATVIDAIQTDAAINPGNSGGALVNGAGEVVGINTAIATVASDSGFGGQQSQSGNIGVGFAIPSNTAKRISEQIIKTGKATHAVLGVSARTATTGSNSEAGLGAQVIQVVPGSGADKAGLHAGDIITAVGDRVITSSTELTAAVRSASPGSKVTLTVSNGGNTRTVDVTLGETS